MANLKAIRKRIATAKSTQKITKAMKLVSAAKLRRAQEQVVAQRPYARHLAEVVRDLAARADGESHALLASRPGRRIEVVVITSDRGLCGGFNANINRQLDRLLLGDFKVGRPLGDEATLDEVRLSFVGKKGRDYSVRRKRAAHTEHPAAQSPTALERARETAGRISRDFASDHVDAVYLVYNEFKSAISQRVLVEQLLPLQTPKPSAASDTTPGGDYLYEPSEGALLGTLLPMYVETLILRALLDSIASEHGARMSAMDSATKNAKEMISSLTLQYNRARQAAITKELMEIIGGAEALKG